MKKRQEIRDLITVVAIVWVTRVGTAGQRWRGKMSFNQPRREWEKITRGRVKKGFKNLI